MRLTYAQGIDVSKLKIVVQYQGTCNLKVLMQRFGRCARLFGSSGTAILLVDKKDLASVREAKAQQKEEKKYELELGEGLQKGNKRKGGTMTPGNERVAKKRALTDASTNMPVPNPNGPSTTMPTSPLASPPDPPVPPQPTQPSVVRLSDAQRAAYAKIDRSGVEDGVDGRQGTQIHDGSALYHFVNPETGGYTCRRVVPKVYLGSGRRKGDVLRLDYPAQDFSHESTFNRRSLKPLACDPSQAEECIRCRPKACPHCCDLCDPEYFTKYTTPPPQRHPGPITFPAN